MKNTLWVEKYRPTTLEDYVWINDDHRIQVQSWIRDQEIPNLILSGGPGVGKSTTAKLLMIALNVPESDIIFENASKKTGIDFIRDLENFIETMPAGKYRYVILDEADRLSVQAQDALKSMIEEYSNFSRWIFTTNRPHKIIAPLHSRLQGFHIDSLDREQFLTRAATILIQEGIELDDEGVEILDEFVTVTWPDLRKCINQLQQFSKTGKLIRPSTSSSGSQSEYLVNAVNLFKAGKIHDARKLICANASENEYEEIYSLLYKNLSWWGKTDEAQHKAIVIIANRLKDHSMVADPEIALAACLIELSMID